MKCSLGISNFLKEISNLSHSIGFLYFFALITEEGFLTQNPAVPLASLGVKATVQAEGLTPLPLPAAPQLHPAGASLLPP